MTDSEQRHFDNISSLVLEWEVSNISLASVPSQQPSTLVQADATQDHDAAAAAMRSEFTEKVEEETYFKWAGIVLRSDYYEYTLELLVFTCYLFVFFLNTYTEEVMLSSEYSS